MAFSLTLKALFFALTLLSISTFCCKSDDGAEDSRNSFNLQDPAQLVAKALACFNHKFIYSSCQESYRLTQSGNLNIPRGSTDEYCNGPCFSETHLVLNCIDNIFSNFLFYNRATVQDIGDTIKAGCSDGSERGNFNVAEHLQYSGGGQRIFKSLTNFHLYIFCMIVSWCGFML